MAPHQSESVGPTIVNQAIDLGAVVRARRKEQALRIDDAASLSGVSVDLLSRLENGTGGVRLDKLLTVLEGLGLTLVIGPKDHDWSERVATAPPLHTNRVR